MYTSPIETKQNTCRMQTNFHLPVACMSIKKVYLFHYSNPFMDYSVQHNCIKFTDFDYPPPKTSMRAYLISVCRQSCSTFFQQDRTATRLQEELLVHVPNSCKDWCLSEEARTTGYEFRAATAASNIRVTAYRRHQAHQTAWAFSAVTDSFEKMLGQINPPILKQIIFKRIYKCIHLS